MDALIILQRIYTNISLMLNDVHYCVVPKMHIYRATHTHTHTNTAILIKLSTPCICMCVCVRKRLESTSLEMPELLNHSSVRFVKISHACFSCRILVKSDVWTTKNTIENNSQTSGSATPTDPTCRRGGYRWERSSASATIGTTFRATRMPCGRESLPTTPRPRGGTPPNKRRVDERRHSSACNGERGGPVV